MSLEAGYRRLLACYPAAHRREYEDEMIAVLLADSAAGQQRPSPGDVLDVLRSAAVIRWRLTAHRTQSELWHRTAYVAQIFGAILLLGIALRRVALAEVWRISLPAAAGPYHVDPVQWARPLAWLAVLIAALAGRRIVGAGFTMAAATAEIAAPAQLYVDTPARLLNVYWIIVAALVMVWASLLARRGTGPLLPPGTIPLTLAGFALVASALGDLVPGGLVPGGLVPGGLVPGGRVLGGLVPDGLSTPMLLGGRVISLTGAALLALAATLAAISAWRLEPPIRRRLLICAVPVAVAVPLLRIGFGGFIESNMRRPTAELLGPLQWAALVIIPATASYRAAVLNRRFEKSCHQPPTPKDPPPET